MERTMARSSIIQHYTRCEYLVINITLIIFQGDSKYILNSTNYLFNFIQQLFLIFWENSTHLPFLWLPLQFIFLVYGVASPCLYHSKGLVLWLQCSNGYKWASHQGSKGCCQVGSVRRLWRPALAEEEEDKLVEIRSIRPGRKSTQENKKHWCANTFIAKNNELWNNDI